MDRKHEIIGIRERLDKTLALPDLSNEESIKSLVKQQLLNSSISSFKGNVDKCVEKRTKEVSTFLEILRSASKNEIKANSQVAGHIDWKIKQDTDELRVMYREGPQGTPFHSLLAEGYADGPLDVCLCVAWESSLYKKWFPQYKVPTFKVSLATSLQKVRVGEEISLVRVKVPWPISDREALLHYFEIEYLQQDLFIVLINTISSKDQCDESINGFSGSIIPEAQEATRIDIVGGFVMQKIDHSRSYFRTIATMDIKLDFVPPWLINFMSRQLIGHGHKLFQKVLRTVTTHDVDYRKALEGPMYARIREGLGVRDRNKTTKDDLENERPIVLPEKHIGDCATEIMSVRDSAYNCEIMDEQNAQNSLVEYGKLNKIQSNNINNNHHDLAVQEFNRSPEVDYALHILDSTIAVLQKPRENKVKYTLPFKHSLDANKELIQKFMWRRYSTSKNSHIKQLDKISKSTKRIG